MSERTAKLFWNGGSQALRIPKEFRLPGEEVVIRREGIALVIEPIQEGWDDEFWSLFGQLDDDFDVGDRTLEQQRDWNFPNAVHARYQHRQLRVA